MAMRQFMLLGFSITFHDPDDTGLPGIPRHHRAAGIVPIRLFMVCDTIRLKLVMVIVFDDFHPGIIAIFYTWKHVC